ncbi:chemotaxis protein [Arhodomonas sp. AD133]|uniref:chemotaxis protein n=1 Tax=Arhodomonas sp. AD133 TaxID=3415009 RepID=UPI003EC08CC8
MTRNTTQTAETDQRSGVFELLCFRVGARRYGITVFKVEGVVPAPRGRTLLGAPPGIAGIARIRDRTVPLVDLAPLLHPDAMPQTFQNVILTDCERRLLGFGVGDIEGIVRVAWKDVMKPPAGAGRDSQIMGVVRDDHGLIQLLEFEEIIDRVAPLAAQALDGHGGAPAPPPGAQTVLVVDDSRLARSRMSRTLDQAGWDVLIADNGEQALELLERCDRESPERLQCLQVVVSDVEMPGVDGYTLCQRLRADSRFSHLRLLLHTSLSGQFDEYSLRRAGADDFLSKFDAGELARRVHRLATEEAG